jgi:hypothetical protein
MFGLGAVVFLLGATGEAVTQNPNKAVWLKDYAAARDVARTSGKPIFLVFR